MIRPTEDRILVLEEERQEEVIGGITVPVSARAVNTIGTVVAVGPGRWTEYGSFTPMILCVTDRVGYSAISGGVKVKDGELEYTVLRQADVLVVYPPKQITDKGAE